MIKAKRLKGGKIALDITCDICGNPITHSNKYGMFCDNECELEASKKAFTKVKGLLKGVLKEIGKC
jgi:hypothetical protein